MSAVNSVIAALKRCATQNHNIFLIHNLIRASSAYALRNHTRSRRRW
jgi:hypothetical protein